MNHRRVICMLPLIPVSHTGIENYAIHRTSKSHVGIGANRKWHVPQRHQQDGNQMATDAFYTARVGCCSVSTSSVTLHHGTLRSKNLHTCLLLALTDQSQSNNICTAGLIWSRDSAVGVATGYGLDDRWAGVRVSIGSRILYSSLCLERVWGPPSFLPSGYRRPI
jgi:hypothetical protein